MRRHFLAFLKLVNSSAQGALSSDQFIQAKLADLQDKSNAHIMAVQGKTVKKFYHNTRKIPSQKLTSGTRPQGQGWNWQRWAWIKLAQKGDLLAHRYFLLFGDRATLAHRSNCDSQPCIRNGKFTNIIHRGEKLGRRHKKPVPTKVEQGCMTKEI